ncbi:hypothetical protein Shyhy02_57750 [Streptomyces hygroscopicus subsp. hygroscopicus]|nr:hypothetical protein Shyhy02_57750 [Streptomyces hygroscopicus subsp. hygroscopicus]
MPRERGALKYADGVRGSTWETYTDSSQPSACPVCGITTASWTTAYPMATRPSQGGGRRDRRGWWGWEREGRTAAAGAAVFSMRAPYDTYVPFSFYEAIRLSGPGVPRP